MMQQPQTIDQKTLELEALLLQIAHAAEEFNKLYYFGGGFAVDLSFGGLTRSHEDLDFYPVDADMVWWKEWFRAHNYLVSRDVDMNNLLSAFSVLRKAPRGMDKDCNYLVDVYPIMVAPDGSISMKVKAGVYDIWDGMLTMVGDRGLWPGKSWYEVQAVKYKNQTIVLENYKTVLQQKETYIKLHHGEKLSDKHLRDFKRAGILPSV